MNIWKAPTISSHDVFDRARMRMTWNIHLMLFVVFTLLGTLSIWTQPEFVPQFVLSLVLIIISMIYMKRKKKFAVIAIVMSVLIEVLILMSLYGEDKYVHFMEPIWLLLNCLLMYFIAGKQVGRIFLVVTMLSTVGFFFYRLELNLENLKAVTTEMTITMAVEFMICMSLMGHVLHQFIRTRDHAEKGMRRAYNALLKEKTTVEAQDKEKTALLQEIHHRVKNNLQIVTSLLRMQSEKISSPEAKAQFKDAINRVHSMSLIHQKMYQNENLADIRVDEYIESLIDEILVSARRNVEIKRKVHTRINHVGIKTMVPMALIITELVMNSIKHAFEYVSQPEIQVSVEEDNSDIFIRYLDNGRWKENAADTFGLQMISTFTDQLEGTVKRTSTELGTTYEFRVKNLDEDTLTAYSYL